MEVEKLWVWKPHLFFLFKEDPYPLTLGWATSAIVEGASNGQMDWDMVPLGWRTTTSPRCRVFLVVYTTIVCRGWQFILGHGFPRRSRLSTAPRRLVGRYRYDIDFWCYFIFFHFLCFFLFFVIIWREYVFFCGGECNNSHHFLCRHWTCEAQGFLETQPHCSC